MRLDFGGAFKRVFSTFLLMVVGVTVVNFLGPLILHIVRACDVPGARHLSSCADLWHIHYEKYFVAAVIFGLLFRMNRAASNEQRQVIREWKAERRRAAERRSWKS